MKRLIHPLSLSLILSLLALGSVSAQTSPTLTNAATAPVAAVKKPVPGPFHGKVAAVNKTARTIQVGKRTFYVSPDCKLTKAGKPAKLEDAVLGEVCGGYMRPSPEGKLVATTLRLGPKVVAAPVVTPTPAASK